MPHPIIRIDELLRLVIDELVAISPRTVASFALTCRSLEEPALSSLWKQQDSLDHLLRVLPCYTRVKVQRVCDVIVSGHNLPVYRI